MQYLGHSWLYPPGSIMSYIGTSDPDGWIICNGILRTATDNRYSLLAGLLGGTGNSITPPDLRDRFLYSTNSSNLTTGGSTNITLTNANIPRHNHTIDISDTKHSHTNSVLIAAHSHEITIVEANHTHADTINNPTHSHTANLYQTNNKDFSSQTGEGPAADTELTPDDGATYWTTLPTTPTISVNNARANGTFTASVTEYINADALTLTKTAATTNITATSRNSGSVTPTSFSILPLYATVNYIIKY